MTDERRGAPRDEDEGGGPDVKSDPIPPDPGEGEAPSGVEPTDA